MRVFQILLLVICVCSLSSCVSRQATKPLEGVKVPSFGDPISDDVWAAADAADQRIPVRSRTAAPWIFPFQFYLKDFQVSPDHQEAVLFSTNWNDLLIPPLSLPLRISIKASQYKRGVENPVSTQRFTWTPLFATSSMEGSPVGNVSYTAAGVPLFYGFAKIGSIDGSTTVKFRQMLWTLGPAAISVKSDTSKLPDGVKTLESGYFFAPVLLGGVGSLLWSDLDFKRANNDHDTAHGPVFGALGFYSWRRTYDEKEVEDKRIESGSRLLLGLLWRDYLIRELESNEVRDSVHGPLWGMFGWGQKDGKRTVRLFWLPIKIG